VGGTQSASTTSTGKVLVYTRSTSTGTFSPATTLQQPSLLKQGYDTKVSADGSVIAVMTELPDVNVLLYNKQSSTSWTLNPSFPLSDPAISDMSLSRDGTTIALAKLSATAMLTVYARQNDGSYTQQGALNHPLSSGAATAVALTSDGNQAFVLSGIDNSFYVFRRTSLVWAVRFPTVQFSGTNLISTYAPIVVSADGTVVIAGGRPPSFFLYDSVQDTYTMKQTLTPPSDSSTDFGFRRGSIALTRQSTYLLIGDWGTQINSASNYHTGSVFVYQYSSANALWTQVPGNITFPSLCIQKDTGNTYSNLGQGIGASDNGDVLAFGAYGDSGYQGAVFIVSTSVAARTTGASVSWTQLTTTLSLGLIIFEFFP
jgi:hypothetical protein